MWAEEKDNLQNIHSNVDNTYSVEVPSNATQGRCILDLMSFENTNSHLSPYNILTKEV